MTAVPVRIYADFNGLVPGVRDPQRIAVVLDTFGSVRDLANAGLLLREGLPLVAVDASDDVEDLEGHGTAHFDPKNRWWVIEFDEQGVRYVPAGDRQVVDRFLCVRCQYEFPEMNPHMAFDAATRCTKCGTPPSAPIAPPSE